MKFKILCSEGGKEGIYRVFDVKCEKGMTVLDALFYIQEELEPALSFRYSCRGAVCGSCAMLINRFPMLACRTQIEDIADVKRPALKQYPALVEDTDWDAKNEILIEPLPHLPVIKDLVVDMREFFEAYRAFEPYFMPSDDAPEKERSMTPEHVKQLEPYTNCILCAACFGACPVRAEIQGFTGPAALAKLYRFAMDPREKKTEYRLMLGDGHDGWDGCEFHLNCLHVCPKGVTPNMAIGEARSRLRELKKKNEED